MESREQRAAGFTEITWNGLATYSEPTFRTYGPEVIVDEKLGQRITLQLCEDFVEESGRWEPFYATLRREAL